MSAKDIIIDFINLLFVLFLIIVFIVYFVLGDRLGSMTRIMQIAAPFSVFGLIALARVRWLRREIVKQDREAQAPQDFTLHLSIFDKFRADAVTFGTPFLILGIIVLKQRALDSSAIISAAVVCLILYFWHRYLFSRD